jgi:hypothetical protein
VFQPLIEAIIDTAGSARNKWVERTLVSDQLRRTGKWSVEPFNTFKDYTRAAAEQGYVFLTLLAIGGGPNYIALA